MMNFKPTEAAALGMELEKLERPKAQARRKATQNNNAAQSSSVSVTEQAEKGDTRDKVGKAVGMSGVTYQRSGLISNRWILQPVATATNEWVARFAPAQAGTPRFYRSNEMSLATIDDRMTRFNIQHRLIWMRMAGELSIAVFIRPHNQRLGRFAFQFKYQSVNLHGHSGILPEPPQARQFDDSFNPTYRPVPSQSPQTFPTTNARRFSRHRDGSDATSSTDAPQDASSRETATAGVSPPNAFCGSLEGQADQWPLSCAALIRIGAGQSLSKRT